MSRVGWAVEFRSVYSDSRCYLGWMTANGGPIRSEVVPENIALFGSEAEVLAFMEDRDLDPKRPVPVGAHHIYPAAVRLDLAALKPAPDWLTGVLFELARGAAGSVPGRPGPAPAPIPRQATLF